MYVFFFYSLFLSPADLHKPVLSAQRIWPCDTVQFEIQEFKTNSELTNYIQL
jgi:hypothetical protein